MKLPLKQKQKEGSLFFFCITLSLQLGRKPTQVGPHRDADSPE